MWLNPKLISEYTPTSNFSPNHEDNENDQDKENHPGNKNKSTQQTSTCSKSTIEKSPGFFMVSFKHISHLVLVLLMSILNI